MSTIRPDELSKYAPRWLREGAAKPRRAVSLSPAPQLATIQDEPPWRGPSPFDDQFGVQQTFEASVDTPESDLVHVGPVKKPFKTAGNVSFALIAMLTLALVMDETLTALSGTPAEATTASDDAPVAPIAATAQLVTNVEDIVAVSNSPAPLETQPQQLSDPQQVQQPQTAEVPAQRVSERVLDWEEIDQLIRRGEMFLAQGDFATARLFLMRAAEARDPRAALLLGTTYDPEFLRRMGAVGIQPDPEQEHLWYAQAAEFGSHEASQRLAALALPAR
jgi:hypothetical protein